MKRRPAATLAGLLGVIMLAPFAWLLALSFARHWRYPALWPTAWQSDQWRTLDSGWNNLTTLAVNSLLLALCVGVTATFAGFYTSRALASQAGMRGWLALAGLPFALSPVVYGLCIGQAYSWFGLSGAYAGVALAQFPFAYGYAVLICHGFWTPQTRALNDLARTLGANRWQRTLRVELPLAAGLLGLCLFQTALMSWFDFTLTRVIGAGRVQTLTLAVFDYFSAGDLRLACASALLLIAPPTMALAINPALLLPAAARRTVP